MGSVKLDNRKSTLDGWVKNKIGLPESVRLRRIHIRAYQIQKLHETLESAEAKSPFYKKHLAAVGSSTLKSFEDWSRIPFTTAEDLRENGLQFLCVSQSDIRRVVTLQTSGTTAAPKRLFFTDHDLEMTVDFFHHGMKNLVTPGATVLVLMPGEAVGSIGDLLKKGLAQMNVRAVVHGLVTEPEAVLDVIRKERVDCLVGIPSQVLALARAAVAAGDVPGSITSVLLSADYVPSSVVRAIEDVWRCPVLSHYGMTEMGFGGGVECSDRSGYHMREADLFFEIIDPRTGCPLPSGHDGEIVFTTLNREGMPLIRYRTGDMARWIPGSCPCGSVLRRMGLVKGRIGSWIKLGSAGRLSIADLDEALFAISTLHDFRAEISVLKGRDLICLDLCVRPGTEEMTLDAVRQRLTKLAAVKSGMIDGTVGIGPIRICHNRGMPLVKGKRRLVDCRQSYEPADIQTVALKEPRQRGCQAAVVSR